MVPGTPDINYTTGWIENKVVKAWPKNPDAVLLVPKYNQAQRIWHRQRREAGGEVYLLLKVGPDWLLFDGKVASEVVGNATRAQLLASAIHHWVRELNGKELVKCLTN